MGESLDLLLDERAITRLLVTHCASIDDGRFDVTASLYADATWWITDGKPLHGTEAVTAFLNVHARNIRTSTRADPPTAQSRVPPYSPHLAVQHAQQVVEDASAADPKPVVLVFVGDPQP
ncbi:nuclear transport factor 2 family protein [Nocardia brasiliensis]|uniref:nuclear transport factor 2 family protein n=1 Tax=Nocardia brasiliensis TaxID=37326 RepID=UPI0018952DC9|nr:nuclear transport factor 2 family protein [Nocardia brasiliensis]MBF6548692.1 nuclear transport factor 2 family protein [Nocardia brasiliensis]